MYNRRLDIFRTIKCIFLAIIHGRNFLNSHCYENEKELQVTIIASKTSNKFRVMDKDAKDIEYGADEEIFRHAGLIFSKCKYCGKMNVDWVRYYRGDIDPDKVKKLYPKED